MSKGPLLVTIAGREAVPVRAIPYITGWTLSPLDMARHLARNDGPPFGFFNDVVAYHLQARVPQPMLPKEWDSVSAQLAALEASIRATHQDEDIGFAEWRQTSVRLLPAGVFVFKDAFEEGWGRQFKVSDFKERREGDGALNYTPLISPGMQPMVMAGFEHVLLGEWKDRMRRKAASNAPPPISPVSGTGGLAPRVVVRTRPQPDWSFWRLRTYVKDWEAAALCVGIDPDSMKRSPHGWMAGTSEPVFLDESFRSAEEKGHFCQRYRLVSEWARLHGDSVTYRRTGEVELRKFASWAVANCLPAQAEFEALAAPNDRRPGKSAGAPTRTGQTRPSDFEATASVIAMSQVAPFVERKDLVVGFDIDKEWWDIRFKSLSRKIPRWLADAIEDKRPGPTGANLFNPAVVALGLLREKVRTKTELLKAMRSNEKFAPFVEQFKLGLDTDTAD